MPDDLILFFIKQRIAGVTHAFEQNDYIERLHLAFRTPLGSEDARRLCAWVLRESDTWLLEQSSLNYPQMQLRGVIFVRARRAQVNHG